MKANKFNQGGIESFLQPSMQMPAEAKSVSGSDTQQTKNVTVESKPAPSTTKVSRDADSSEKNSEPINSAKSGTTTSKNVASRSETRSKKSTSEINASEIDSDRIMKDYLPYLTSKRARQNKSNRVSYLLTDKAMYTLDAIENTTGFKKNAIINAILEKEAEKYGYTE